MDTKLVLEGNFDCPYDDDVETAPCSIHVYSASYAELRRFGIFVLEGENVRKQVAAWFGQAGLASLDEFLNGVTAPRLCNCGSGMPATCCPANNQFCG